MMRSLVLILVNRSEGMMKYAIVLAAGKGTRMKSNYYKVLHEVHGQPMLQHVIDSLKNLSIDRKIIVVGAGADEVMRVMGNAGEYVLQKEQLGTGHAVMVAGELLKDLKGTTLVICGDTPLLTPETLNHLMQVHQQNHAAATVLTTVLDDPSGYGRIIRNEDGNILKIVEHKDATPKEREIKEINTGTYCFDNELLFSALNQITNHNAQGEYYLTDVIQILQQQGFLVGACMTEDALETLGINDRVSLAKANQVFKEKVNRKLMLSGVTIVDPEHTYISKESCIGKDTIIYPGTIIRGRCVIGENCIIGPNTELENTLVGDYSTIKHSVVSDSTIGKNTKVGPFAHLRNHCIVGDEVRLGNFVEIKNSTIGNNTNAAHLSYIGDADLGHHVNMGCGSITVNFDGTKKHRTKIGNYTFVGCNTNLIAPLNVGNQVYIAAGSTITDDLPDQSFAIARERQTTKLNYQKKENQ